MERNANDTFGNQNSGDATSGGGFGGTGGTGSQAGSQGTNASGTGGFGGSTGGSTGAGGYGGTSDASFSRDASTETGGISDRARGAMGTAQEKLADAGSTVRDKAGNLKNSLADVLESGAEKLRTQGAGGGQYAGAMATGGSDAMVSDGSRTAGATNQIAGGLQASADWLRDADLDSMKSGIERQVKDHPGRTLAIAVGVGYLLGKAIRK
jgi:ElaB/YqjD/DUF883 family membrane-anchored ribosome-binding protein